MGGAVALAPTDVRVRYLLGQSPVFDVSLVTPYATGALGRSPARRFVPRPNGFCSAYGASLGALVSAA